MYLAGWYLTAVFFGFHGDRKSMKARESLNNENNKVLSSRYCSGRHWSGSAAANLRPEYAALQEPLISVMHPANFKIMPNRYIKSIGNCSRHIGGFPRFNNEPSLQTLYRGWLPAGALPHNPTVLLGQHITTFQNHITRTPHQESGFMFCCKSSTEDINLVLRSSECVRECVFPTNSSC